MPMHIHKLMSLPVYMHIYPYTCTCSYIQIPSTHKNYQNRTNTNVISNRMPTIGCISPAMHA